MAMSEFIYIYIYIYYMYNYYAEIEVCCKVHDRISLCFRPKNNTYAAVGPRADEYHDSNATAVEDCLACSLCPNDEPDTRRYAEFT